MRLIHSSVIAVLMFAAGCATSPLDLSSDGVAEQSKITRDQFKKFTGVRGPEFRFVDPKKTGGLYWYYFSAIKRDQDRTIHYFVNVHSMLTEWAFWQEMVDLNGARFPLNNQSQVVMSGGTCWEISDAELSREYLIENKSGVTLAFYSKRLGGMAVPISPNAITGFLKACDSTFGKEIP